MRIALTLALTLAAGLLAVPGLTAPAQAEVIIKSDSGFAVRSSGLTRKTLREAWAVLTTPSGWWDKEHTWSGDAANLTLDPRAAGCFCEALALAEGAPAGSRRGSVEHMHVIFADPGKVLRMSGSLGPLQSEAMTATLTITLKPVEGGTRILWEYVGAGFMRYKPDMIVPAVDAMLAGQLDRLIARIDAGAVIPAVPAARKSAVRAKAAGATATTPAASATEATAAPAADIPAAPEATATPVPAKPRTTAKRPVRKP